MPFSLDFLVLPVKRSDMSVKYKRQLNLTHHKQRATKITYLVVHRDSHLIYKRYKVQKKIFNGHPRCTSINVHKTHCFCILSFILFHTKHTYIFCFNGPPRYTSINVHKTHSVFFFFWFYTWQCLFLFIKVNWSNLIQVTRYT